MTNEEILKRQREHREHMAAAPAAIENVRARLIDFNGAPLDDNEPPRDGILCSELRTVLREVERLQAQVKQLNTDLRDEQREARHAAGAAYTDGRHDGLQEGRGY